jgi:hypothetical protein
MYKVQYKSHNASQAWSTHGTYGSEASALSAAERIAGKNFMVRVLDPDGHVVWSA